MWCAEHIFIRTAVQQVLPYQLLPILYPVYMYMSPLSLSLFLSLSSRTHAQQAWPRRSLAYKPVPELSNEWCRWCRFSKPKALLQLLLLVVACVVLRPSRFKQLCWLLGLPTTSRVRVISSGLVFLLKKSQLLRSQRKDNERQRWYQPLFSLCSSFFLQWSTSSSRDATQQPPTCR